MINDFLRPILLVGLFKPPEELSAAVTMELLYYYALAHQDSFDVRWIQAGSIAEQLIAPLADRLVAQCQLTVQEDWPPASISMNMRGPSMPWKFARWPLDESASSTTLMRLS